MNTDPDEKNIPPGYLLHDKPCGQCRHIRSPRYHAYCAKLLMHVTACMRVCYKPGELCFEEVPEAAKETV